MLVLAVDTCVAACQAALAEGPRVLARRSEPMARGHQERLAPMVAEVMDEARIAFSQVDRIAVTLGPGSFTGLRVGLAFAKGLSLALARPCVGVGTLAALAASAGIGGAPCAAVIDAGRGRVYLQAFRDGQPRTGPASLDLAEALARLVETFPLGGFCLVGPGASLLADLAPAARIFDVGVPDPAVLARLAAAAPMAPVEPIYLRPPDAVPKALRPA
jgi:tRNA threonylcarbamoyladenosine biosynthesis protein TsaB